MCTSVRQRGISLIELIMFIVIVSTALAGILAVMNVTTCRRNGNGSRWLCGTGSHWCGK